VVFGGFGGAGQFSFMGSWFLALCRWFWVVLGELGNYPSWRVDLEHCVGGLWVVLGEFGNFFYGELIWGTV
jgi:hypothetical protein